MEQHEYMRSNKPNKRNQALEYADYVIEVNFVEIPEDEQKKRSSSIIKILVDNAIKIGRKKLA